MSDVVPGGFILLSRALTESEVWTRDPHHLKLWVYLLLKCNARKDKVLHMGPVEIGYGQVLKSFRKIIEDNEWVENQAVHRWSKSRVGRMLDRFEDAEMIATLGTDLGTLITIRNMARYQDFSSYRADLGTGLGTQSGRSRDNNKHSSPIPKQTDVDSGNDTTPSPTAAFDDFWKVAAKKVGKLAAERSFKTAMKRKDSDTLMERWAAFNAGINGDLKFVPNPATWLNQGRWLDEVAEAPGGELGSAKPLDHGGFYVGN